MQLDEALENVAILGAGGKMGRGIALLLLQEMLKVELKKTGRTDSGQFHLYLIDSNPQCFSSLRTYLHKQLLKSAEKEINSLRQLYSQNPRLVSNEEIIQDYIRGALDHLYFDTHVESAKNATLIFEAILEDLETKVQVFRHIQEQGGKKRFYLTNTSSIPIHLLSEKAGLEGCLIGYHFYNPPAVQKLLEIIVPSEADPDLVDMAGDLAQRLKKIVVYADDVAGFIGNGHMIREIVFACKKVETLSLAHPYTESIYMVNRVTQDWLIRPMGIFQLIDYVGLDVCKHICSIMRTYLSDPNLTVPLLEQMLEKGCRGGQNADGSQKNGFFSYTKDGISGIYSLKDMKYISWSEAAWRHSCDELLGKLPQGYASWKSLHKEQYPEPSLKECLKNVLEDDTLGSKLAQEFLENSFLISRKLVDDHVAHSMHDIETVLKNGFYHLYGADISQLGIKHEKFS
ncbi:MAG: hypothetical protein BGO14_11115 [Chlamydiales bacterium 38-26]|nr:3-hydroxyacyl-CoA dehydrogenase family protein [Chlamydiales bacterium]OJV11500.1 MAG: hypothetical protein BGO14_11115 [Chlamydiales bacterium 38-26]